MYILVPRHTSSYCGEDQPFVINFDTFQDIDKPQIYTTKNVNVVLRAMLKLYFGTETTDKLIESLGDGDAAELETITLFCETHEGKKRYTLVMDVKDFKIEHNDGAFTIGVFPIILAEVFEV